MQGSPGSAAGVGQHDALPGEACVVLSWPATIKAKKQKILAAYNTILLADAHLEDKTARLSDTYAVARSFFETQNGATPGATQGGVSQTLRKRRKAVENLGTKLTCVQLSKTKSKKKKCVRK